MPRLSSQRQDGFILIVVLGAVMVLSTLLFRFSRATQTRLETTYGLYRVEQAWNCARAGLSIAQAGVAETNDVCADRRFADLFAGEDPLPVGEGTCLVRIVEENGLLNVNRLLDKTGQPNRTRVDQMLRLIDLLNRNGGGKERISYGIVPSVIDWVDPDDAVTHLPFVERANRGAEDAYYRDQRPPYRCANRPVDTLDELLRIKAMTPEAYGRLRTVLTCYGEGQIDINTAPMPVIMCLSEQMDAAIAQMIVHRRQMRPFESAAELRDVPGMTDKIFQAVRDSITVSPKMRYYRVISEGTSDGRICTVEAVLFRNRRAQNVDMVYYTEH
jgi:general secretion pathway protein K